MLKCLIVDDEPIARQIVQEYCNQLPQMVDVVQQCESAIDVLTLLKNQTIDLLILDINMPVLSGIALVKSMQTKPKVIFTTAYKEYAIDAFDLQASDYLLKPFTFERFFQAIQKVQMELTNKVETQDFEISTVMNNDFDGLFLKIGKTIYRYTHDAILFLESQRNYTRIVTLQDDVRVYIPLSQLEAQLPSDFIRCHRSYIVNKQHVSKIDGNRIIILSHEIAIGPNMKEQFFAQLGIQ